MQEDRMADTVSGAGRICRRDSYQSRQEKGQAICHAGYEVGQADRKRGKFRRARRPEQV